MKVTKQTLIERIKARCGFTHVQAIYAAQSMIALHKAALFARKRIYFPGLGSVTPTVVTCNLNNLNSGVQGNHQYHSLVLRGHPRSNSKVVKYLWTDFQKDLVNCGFTKREAYTLGSIWNALFLHTLQEGGSIELRGFCSMYVHSYVCKRTRNPRTGEIIGKRVIDRVMFKASPALRKAMDKAYLK